MRVYSPQELSDMLYAEVIHWDMLSLAQADSVQDFRAAEEAALDAYIEAQCAAHEARYALEYSL